MQSSGLDPGLSTVATNVTVGSLFREQVQLGRYRPALAEGTRVWSYAQLNDRVNRLTNVLAGGGVTRGDRIAVLSENRHEYVEAILASAQLGVLVVQNWRQSTSELQYCLELADPKLVLYSERLEPALGRLDFAAPSRICFGAEYEKALALADASELPVVADPEDGLVIIYTSGTTGLPKGAVITARKSCAPCSDALSRCRLPPTTALSPGRRCFMSAAWITPLRRCCAGQRSRSWMASMPTSSWK